MTPPLPHPPTLFIHTNNSNRFTFLLLWVNFLRLRLRAPPPFCALFVIQRCSRLSLTKNRNFGGLIFLMLAVSPALPFPAFFQNGTSFVSFYYFSSPTSLPMPGGKRFFPILLDPRRFQSRPRLGPFQDNGLLTCIPRPHFPFFQILQIHVHTVP